MPNQNEETIAGKLVKDKHASHKVEQSKRQ